jgi:glc operon protein GlcG
VAIAVVDTHGDLIAARRMEGCRPRHMRMAINKAFTAAVMDRNTDDFHLELQRRQLVPSQFGDERFTSLPGGLCVQIAGKTIAAIGVTGRAGGTDLALARAGLPAFGTDATTPDP